MSTVSPQRLSMTNLSANRVPPRRSGSMITRSTNPIEATQGGVPPPPGNATPPSIRNWTTEGPSMMSGWDCEGTNNNSNNLKSENSNNSCGASLNQALDQAEKHQQHQSILDQFSTEFEKLSIQSLPSSPCPETGAGEEASNPTQRIQEMELAEARRKSLELLYEAARVLYTSYQETLKMNGGSISANQMVGPVILTESPARSWSPSGLAGEKTTTATTGHSSILGGAGLLGHLMGGGMGASMAASGSLGSSGMASNMSQFARARSNSKFADHLGGGIHLGNASTCDFIRNLAAFNDKFENPMMAASVASLAGADLITVKSTEKAHLQKDSDSDDEDGGTFDINQYSVLQELGRGTQGCVYLAYDNTTSEFRALKELKRGLTGSAVMEKFKQEVQIMKRLRHQNIVTLHEVIDDPKLKHIYLVLQYVEKGPLVTWTGSVDHVRCEMIDSWRFQYFVRQICAGLSYLHQRKIYHRDIKPENILLGNDDHVFLADFGVAHMAREQRKEEIRARTPGASPATSMPGTPRRSASPSLKSKCTPPALFRVGGRRLSLEQQSTTPPQGDLPRLVADDLFSESTQMDGSLGTPAYFAPELITTPETEFKRLDQAAVDVWALGVTCYQLLTGVLPFSTRSATEPTDPINQNEDSLLGSSQTSTLAPGGQSMRHGSVSTLGGSMTQQNNPSQDQLPKVTDEQLSQYPEDWWGYLRSVVEEPIPYLSDAWLLQHNAANRRSSTDDGCGSASTSSFGGSGSLSPAAGRSSAALTPANSSFSAGRPSPNTISMPGMFLQPVTALRFNPKAPAQPKWNSPVPKEWFSILKGMLIRDPVKRWTLERVRASVKAMGTLHKIENISGTEAPFSLAGGQPLGAMSPKMSGRGLRSAVNASRTGSTHAMAISTDSLECDPDAPWAASTPKFSPVHRVSQIDVPGETPSPPSPTSSSGRHAIDEELIPVSHGEKPSKVGPSFFPL